MCAKNGPLAAAICVLRWPVDESASIMFMCMWASNLRRGDENIPLGMTSFCGHPIRLKSRTGKRANPWAGGRSNPDSGGVPSTPLRCPHGGPAAWPVAEAVRRRRPAQPVSRTGNQREVTVGRDRSLTHARLRSKGRRNLAPERDRRGATHLAMTKRVRAGDRSDLPAQ